MKSTLVSMVLFLSCGMLQAETFMVTPDSLEKGPKAPEVIQNGTDAAFRFKADADDATAARIRGKTFDFSKGVKIELEFQNDAEQTNPFPRLLETGALSLHFAYDANSKDGAQKLKALLQGPSKDQIHQVIVPVSSRPNEWRKLVFIYVPETKTVTLSVDGVSKSDQLPFEFVAKDRSVLLGASGLQGSSRGLSGQMRQIRITTPFAGDEK